MSNRVLWLSGVVLFMLETIPWATAKPATGRVNGRRAQVRSRLERQARQLRGEPTIRRVQRAAIARAGLTPGRLRGWRRRVRRAAWLPAFQVGTRVLRRSDSAVDRKVGSPDLLKAGADLQIAYEIKMSWDLPRLIFDPNELKVARELQRITELRDQLVSQVTRLYFERRRLQLLALLKPPATALAGIRSRLRIAELTALLDALTGGIFRRRR